MEKKILNIVFDAEMTGLNKNDDLISIGLKAESDVDLMFYAEINDFDKQKVTEWIYNNVIANLLYNKKHEVNMVNASASHNIISIKDSFKNVSKELNSWLKSIAEGYDYIQFIADVPHYDFVHLIDLITDKGSALDLGVKIIPDIINLNQILMLPDVRKYIGINEDVIVFDVSREAIYERITGESIEDEENKHNAMYDAIIAYEIFEKVKKYVGL